MNQRSITFETRIITFVRYVLCLYTFMLLGLAVWVSLPDTDKD